MAESPRPRPESYCVGLPKQPPASIQRSPRPDSLRARASSSSPAFMSAAPASDSLATAFMSPAPPFKSLGTRFVRQGVALSNQSPASNKLPEHLPSFPEP